MPTASPAVDAETSERGDQGALHPRATSTPNPGSTRGNLTSIAEATSLPTAVPEALARRPVHLVAVSQVRPPVSQPS